MTDAISQDLLPLPASVHVGGKIYPFTDYADISAAYCKTVKATGAISSLDRLVQGPIAPPCDIRDGSGNSIAWVSHNGKVWAGPLHNNDYRIIFDPSGRRL